VVVGRILICSDLNFESPTTLTLNNDDRNSYFYQ